MNQTIIGFAGRKQAGKGTSYTCIRLWRPEAVEFSFAEPLKRMCVDILGLEEWQAFGNDEQKRTPVPHLLWENFPLPAWNKPDGGIFLGVPNGLSHIRLWHTIKPEICNDGVAINPDVINVKQIQDEVWNYKPDPDVSIHDNVQVIRKRGAMTAREVLQYYGTDIFRKQYHNVWADACIRKIRKSGCPLAVVTDVRFPNEVEAVQSAGGQVIKLTRNPFPEDNHPSEVALDQDRYNQNIFDSILDNASMSINEQCEALYGLMRRWGYVEHKQVGRLHV